jgi:hypothetical protein
MIKKMVGEGWIVVESDSPLANGPNLVRRAMCDIAIEAAIAPALSTDDELNQVRKAFPEAQICPASENAQKVARGEIDPDPIWHLDISVPRPNRPTPRTANDTDIRRFLLSREKQ